MRLFIAIMVMILLAAPGMAQTKRSGMSQWKTSEINLKSLIDSGFDIVAATSTIDHNSAYYQNIREYILKKGNTVFRCKDSDRYALDRKLGSAGAVETLSQSQWCGELTEPAPGEDFKNTIRLY